MLFFFPPGACGCSDREYQRGDEIAWYPDGDKIVRNEYNPATAYAFGMFSFEFEANFGFGDLLNCKWLVNVLLE